MPNRSYPRSKSLEGERKSIDIPRSLVDGIRQGDESAFEEMLIASYGPLYRFAESLLGSGEDAKDVVQEVLINIWRLGERWNPSGSVIAYLLTSVRNQSIKSRKANYRFDTHPMPGDRVFEEVVSLDDVYDQKSQLDELIDGETQRMEALKVEQAINTLSERYRTVYLLRYREGLPVADIAGILDTSYKAAEHLIRRATSEVIKKLKKDSG